MATSLFKMPFDVERLKVERIYASKELENCSVDTLSCEKIRSLPNSMRIVPAPTLPWSLPLTVGLRLPMLLRVR